MNGCVIIVPGWPSAKHPGRMPFLRDFARSIARHTPVTVIVLESVGGALKRGDFFSHANTKNDRGYRVIRIPVVNVRIDWLMDAQLCFWAKIMAWYLAASSPNWVNSHFSKIGIFGQQLASQLGSKHIVTEHSSDFSKAISPRGSSRRAQIAMLRSADSLIAVGPKLADDMARVIDIPRSQIQVIGNGIDDTAVCSAKQAATSNTSATRFIFVGHLIPRKRVLQLVETFNNVDVDHPIELEIIGDGPLKRDLLTLLDRSTRMNRQLRYFGSLVKSDVMHRINNADFLVLPSEYESFGIVAAEALTLGTACFTSRCGGPEHFVRDSIDGYHFDVDDFDTLARLMSEAAAGKIKFDRASLRALNEGRFSWAQIAKEYLSISENIR